MEFCWGNFEIRVKFIRCNTVWIVSIEEVFPTKFVAEFVDTGVYFIVCCIFWWWNMFNSKIQDRFKVVEVF